MSKDDMSLSCSIAQRPVANVSRDKAETEGDCDAARARRKHNLVSQMRTESLVLRSTLACCAGQMWRHQLTILLIYNIGM